jgi:hypothetical protein
MARLGKTGDARKHAHALELSRFEVHFPPDYCINLHEIDFQASTPPWRKSVFCHQHFTAPASRTLPLPGYKAYTHRESYSWDAAISPSMMLGLADKYE